GTTGWFLRPLRLPFDDAAGTFGISVVSSSACSGPGSGVSARAGSGLFAAGVSSNASSSVPCQSSRSSAGGTVSSSTGRSSRERPSGSSRSSAGSSSATAVPPCAPGEYDQCARLSERPAFQRRQTTHLPSSPRQESHVALL